MQYSLARFCTNCSEVVQYDGQNSNFFDIRFCCNRSFISHGSRILEIGICFIHSSVYYLTQSHAIFLRAGQLSGFRAPTSSIPEIAELGQPALFSIKKDHEFPRDPLGRDHYLPVSTKDTSGSSVGGIELPVGSESGAAKQSQSRKLATSVESHLSKAHPPMTQQRAPPGLAFVKLDFSIGTKWGFNVGRKARVPSGAPVGGGNVLS
jgi:hypothetical protein